MFKLFKKERYLFDENWEETKAYIFDLGNKIKKLETFEIILKSTALDDGNDYRSGYNIQDLYDLFVKEIPATDNMKIIWRNIINRIFKQTKYNDCVLCDVIYAILIGYYADIL